jgi:hypothetical protein
MKTLIITVGTRQVGWRCADGIVRCLGADGDRGAPAHIDEMYQQFGLVRSYHGDIDQPQYAWSVRHLGELVYQQCLAAQDFSAVVLLLDQVVVEHLVAEGLAQIILWGTDQPEGTPWNFRRGDTLWLTELMAGAIRQTWPSVSVDVWNPVVAVNQVQSLRREVEGFIFPYVLDRFQADTAAAFELWIQNKGCTPSVAGMLEICAAALTRQCAVNYITPQEPREIYLPLEAGRSAQAATECQRLSVGDYFWPLERERIRSAWQQGNFVEAQVWLTAHQGRHAALYKLAGHLGLAVNGQVRDALKQLRDGWLRSRHLPAEIAQLQQWNALIAERLPQEETPNSDGLQTWEVTWLIELALYRSNFSITFQLFSQVLERFLFIRCQQEQWIQKRYIQANPNYTGKAEDYNPGLGGLIIGWEMAQRSRPNDPFVKQLNRIRELRNNVVHTGQAVTETNLRSLLGQDSTVLVAMLTVLETVSPIAKPNQVVLREIGQWGLKALSEESSIAQL